MSARAVLPAIREAGTVRAALRTGTNAGLEVVVERADDGTLIGVSVLSAEAKAEYQRLRRACGAKAAAMNRFEKVMEASHAE